MNTILVTVFLVSSLLQARWWSSFIPDVSIASLILLSMRIIPPWVFAVALLGGIFRDGLDASTTWVTPLVYLGIVWFGQFLREHINMSLYITKAMYAVMSVFLFWAVKYLLIGHELNTTILTNLSLTVVLILVIIPALK